MSDDDKIKYRGHHKIISTDEYVCDYCPLVLSHQASMRKHISRKHGDLHAETMKNDTASKLSDSISESDSSDTEDNPKIESERVDFKGFYKIVKTGEFHCNYCPFKISNKSSIRSHVVRKHKELLESGFASKEADESVKRNDSDCVSFDPEDDSRIEGDRIDFKGFHQMTKTGEFGCNFCPFTISNKSSIRSHVVRKHKELLERELASKKADESVQNDDSNDQLKQECSSDEKSEDALPHEVLKVVLKEGKSKVKLSPVDIVRRCFRKSSSQSVYRCPTCPYKSRKRSNFRDHLRRQHPTIWSNFRKPKIVDHPLQLKHKCLYCPIEYFSRASLRSHVARVHRKGENREDAVVSPGLTQALTGYACYLCDFIGSSLPSLKRHVNRVHEDTDMYHGQIPATSFDCDACNFQCENRKEMKDHIEGHKPKPSIDGRYKCTDCDFDANLPGIVQLHMSVTHLPPKITKIPDHVNCDRCDFTCINKRVMEWHKEQHDLPPERARQILTCHECGFFSWNKTLLRRHILKKHEEPTEGCEVYMGLKSERRRKEPVHVPIPCSHCSYIAKNKTTLDFHVIRKHTGSLEHECEHCGKKFKLNHDLTRHVKVKHLDTKIYICDVCGQVYNTSNGLYTHQRYAHFKREFACHLCPKRLANQANLDEHILKQHEQRQDFICEECGKIFKESRTLKAHLRIHTGYKPYVCKVCNKSFGKGSGLRQHMLIHSDQRLYICDICGKSYAQKTGLICHRKSHPGPLPPLPALPRVAVDRVLSRLLHGRE
ncbi:hypothetical protein QAD02_010894 [Eretmocerus hayati]|uniref:Uncharacterized protein n=1 Tax=Eretmocerus hayati TaxID=131215 RepID=A0ACC2NW83_9HYME|nr:hypothetical protein QAD02_010894 [Eretmocerus hayati]